MLTALPANWLEWCVGGGLCVVFLWVISVPPARERVDDALIE
ncbi:hypothetical protein [Paraburkholderia sejongensis]|nr:hypothetical protein [Paraburkholderia sp. MMS20-SJTR3]